MSKLKKNRLGRGLSSLLSGSVAIEPPEAPEPPEVGRADPVSVEKAAASSASSDPVIAPPVADSAPASPDGARLATGGFDGRVRIYESQTGKLVREFVPVPIETSSAGRP